MKTALSLFTVISLIIFVRNGMVPKVFVAGTGGAFGCTIITRGVANTLNDDSNSGCDSAAGQYKQLETDKGGNRFTILDFK